MSYTPYKPEKLFIEASVLNYINTELIINKLSHLKPVIVEDISTINPLELSYSLILAEQKGGFFKRCPGTKKYICCGYKILNIINNCEIDCTYCILQGYFQSPQIIVYVNIEDMLYELDQLFQEYPDHIFRIGTGELADSLGMDHITGYSKILVRYFADKKNAVLELKTKTTQTDNFINIDHKGRTIVSWSLNTPQIIASEESKSANLDQRLIAAKKCQDAGFKIGFHFDPMIYYDNWEQDYKYTVDKIFDYIHPQNIIWISLGALRYPPHLDNIIRETHPQSEIIYGELFPGFDGKLRYYKPIRINMFKKMYQWIKHYDENIFIYLCMESSEIYQKAFGETPSFTSTLKRKMDDLVKI